VEAFVAGDAATMTALLARDATFHSPVTDYRGRGRVGEVLAALLEVVTEVRLTRLFEGADGTAGFFTASADGRGAEGVLLVVAAPDGPASDVTLMVRPLSSLLSGIERMKALLGRDRGA
jgi:ketosteroid isomerase-like protein